MSPISIVWHTNIYLSQPDDWLAAVHIGREVLVLQDEYEHAKKRINLSAGWSWARHTYKSEYSCRIRRWACRRPAICYWCKYKEGRNWSWDQTPVWVSRLAASLGNPWAVIIQTSDKAGWRGQREDDCRWGRLVSLEIRVFRKDSWLGNKFCMPGFAISHWKFLSSCPKCQVHKTWVLCTICRLEEWQGFGGDKE